MAVNRVINHRHLILSWIESRSRPSTLLKKRGKTVADVFNQSQELIIYHPHQGSILRHVSTSSSSSLPSLAPTSQSNKTTTSCDQLDLSFNDARAAFRSKKTSEVIRAYMVFQLCGISWLVKNNHMLMTLGRNVLGKTLFEKAMQMSFYGHFVAGENQVSIQPQIQRMRNFGVKAILDYSVEEDITEEQVEESFSSSKPEALPDNKGSSEDSGAVIGGKKEGYARYKPQEKFKDRRAGINAARTYFYMNEAQCEKNMETFLQSIEAVSGATKGTGFAAIKITALGRPKLLLQVSEAIARVHRYVSAVTGKEGFVIDQNISPDDLKKRLEKAAKKDPTVDKWLESMTFDKSGLIHILPWQGLVGTQKKVREAMQVADLSTGEMHDLIPPLNDQEEEMFKNMMRRLHTIFRVAEKMDVRVMVDAEQTYFQPAISRLCMEMMRIYNKEKAIVFNTYQCYLKESLKNLQIDFQQSERQQFYFGAKLVRGAYMEQERARAKELNYEDPINADYDATNVMYHSCVVESLTNIKRMKATDRPKHYSIMAATHSEDTVRFVIQKMKEFGIEPADRVICFGQLYGMCDQVSFPLGQSGYSVYKYVPYGPVEGVMPYLSRRAQENGSMLLKIAKEKKLLRRELLRRVMSGQMFYKPKGNYEPL